MVLDELAWEYVGPKAILPLSEGDLQLDFFRVMLIPVEEVKGMFEDLWHIVSDFPVLNE